MSISFSHPRWKVIIPGSPSNLRAKNPPVMSDRPVPSTLINADSWLAHFIPHFSLGTAIHFRPNVAVWIYCLMRELPRVADYLLNELVKDLLWFHKHKFTPEICGVKEPS